MKSYIEVFGASAKKHRNETAIVDCEGSRRTTYAELDDMRLRLASKLEAMHFMPGTAIIIRMGRCREYIAAYLGIQTAGLAAVPVTMEYPEDRVSYIEKDCQAGLVITKDFFDDLADYSPAKAVEVPQDTPSHLVYTSGSTGKPKGVKHTVKSMYRVSCGECTLYDIGERVIYAAASTFSFFICVYDLLRPLSIGGEVHIVSDNTRKDVVRLADYYLKNKINMGFISPQLLKNFRIKSPYLHRILAGGELMSNIYSKDYEIINVYGSSETGLVSCFYVDKAYQNTPIGKPFDDCEFSLDGEELCVKVVAAEEYINLPEQTAKTFEKQSDGSVLYHTGDVVRLGEDGNYTYLNRADWMVKVNGQRVETLEIENVIKEMPEIDNAVVKAFADDDGQNYLCAYYVAEKKCSEAKIRSFLASKLPQYMMPRFIVKLDAMPLNINGKLDRLALNPPAVSDYKSEYVAPRNDIEKAVCEAFSEILRCGEVGINDDFFALGGDSIKVLKLAKAIESGCGVAPTQQGILAARTPEKIALQLSKEKKASKAKKQSGKEIPKFLPLTESQKGVYLECMESPESTMYNIPFALRLPEAVDEDKFAEALELVCSRHPALYVTACMKDGEAMMHTGRTKFKLARKKADSIDAEKKTFVKPFNLEKGPLFRFEICTTAEGKFFLMDVHHMVFDGSSVNVLLNQIADAYEGREVPEEAMSIFDLASAELELRDSKEYKAAQEFFEKKFGEVEFETDIITDVAFPEKESGASVFEMPAPAGLSVDMAEHFARKLGISENTLFTAAFAYTAAVFLGSSEACFTTANDGRHNSGLADSVGMFVRTLPMHFTIPEDGEVADFLKDVQSEFYSIMEHDCISFGELVEKYGINTDISFVYQSELLSELRLGGELVMPEELPVGDCQSDMLCMILKTAQGYKLHMQYRNKAYTEGFMRCLAKTVFNVAAGMLSCDKLGEIELIDDNQRAFIDAINSTEYSYDTSRTVNDVIEAVIAENPDKTILSYKDNTYSRKEFDRITKAVAAYVAGKGISQDEYVAVLGPRNDLTVLAAWGAIRAGAGIQMLDPTYPPERLEYMVSDSKARLVISDRSLLKLIGKYEGEVLYSDELMSLPEAPDFHADIRPESALCIIYTSGTTGKPKGCILENRNIVAFAESLRHTMEINGTSRVASYASFGFDAGIEDIVAAPMTGAGVYIIPDEIRLDIGRVEEFYCRNKITQGFMTTQIGRMFAQETKCRSLKVFTVGGEKLVPFTPQSGFRFINGYGPCETMAYICSYEVKDNSKVQPIGKPSINTKLYVSDSRGRLLPPGGCGELCVSGRQVGRGYLNLPEKTAQSFTANPYTSAAAYNRIYKTGDVVRMLPDGNLEFIGRRDGQVKIRGFRVELTEIEEVIRRYNGIKNATVAAFDEPGGGKYVAAYIVANEKIDINSLNAFIRAEKPAYMVPAVTMQIDAIPLTQNGKVNKRALPVPKREASTAEPPQNEIQQKIFDIAAELLGHKDFGITTDFFDAGMTSIITLKFNLELGKAFNKAVKISDIKEHSTIKSLAEFLGAAAESGQYRKLADYPLMQNQMGVFIESGMDRDSVNYNIPVLFKLSDKIDTDRLKSAVAIAIEAHPFLMATLANNRKGEVRSLRHDDEEAVVEVLEAKKLPAEDSLIKPFKLLGERLYRARIYKTEEGNFLFLDIHHIVGDGTSLAILINDINDAYAGKAVEKESFSGFEAALEEDRIASSLQYNTSEEYYAKLLESCNTDNLSEKCPEDSSDKGAAGFSYSLDECSAAITAYCEKHNLTANAFFNAVFSYTLAEFLHADDVTYCTVYNGRNDSRLAECFAMLVKTLPVRCIVDSKAKVLDFVTSMQKQLVDSMTNDIVPFSEISSKYGVKSEIFFNYQGEEFNFNEVGIGGEPAEMVSLELEDAKAPLTIEIFLEKGVYRAKLCYRKDVFCREYADSLAGAIKAAASGFVSAETLKEVSLYSAEEKAYFGRMNDTEVPFEKLPAHTFFERWAEKEGDRDAVRTAETSLTYKELNSKANALANALIARGVGREDIVAMILNRDEFIPIAEIGIMKAGGAFLPMLPTYPDDRLEYCMTDSDCRYVLATKDIIDDKKELFSGDRKYQVLSLEELIAEGDDSQPEVEISQEQLAYCIYTSGSTGTPKGVMIEQHNLSNYVQTSAFRELESNGQTILCIASISFDMSISEIFFSLCQGKTTYIASEEEIHNLDMLHAAFVKNNIDLMCMTPSFAWSLLSLPEFETAMANLGGVILGAEALAPVLLAKFKSLNPEIVVQNGYGPTECTQACSSKTLDEGDNITIGGPFANTKFYVIDDNGNYLPRYAVGELLICGEGVGRGYVKLPEKNKEVFIEADGVRAFRSGDLVRINRDGEAEFGGRRDNQVKLRGFRIELDEVESVMQEFKGVSQSKVVVRNNGTEDFLAGFFTADEKISIDELTEFMKTKLTYYMIPAAMMQLDKMPLTPNGKLDKKALPEIRPVKKERTAKSATSPLEEKILGVFKEVLNLDECYVDDNFFEIGGTSLSASKAVMQIKADGYKIEYQDIFDHQTAEELADYLESITTPVTRNEGEKKEATLALMDSKIAELLKNNTLEHAAEVERKPLGDVLLTGATGFLGAHILKTLLDDEEGHIICLMRKGNYDDVLTRLEATLVYYFEDDCSKAFEDRIILVEGDITEEGLEEKFADIHFDTLINCAACVKHYAKDDSIEQVNVLGVENLIKMTKAHKARMIQISTTSVPGNHTDETYRMNLRMRENELFVIDDGNNQYIRSKYQAELRMLDAIAGGMSGKIIRVGNLMGRYSDGEFQTNMRTNAFLNALRGFVAIGKCPVSHATDPMNFAPIDITAKAIVLLAGTNDMFTAFHADSRSSFDEMKLIEAVNRVGIKITPVPDEEYYADFNRMMADPEQNSKVRALLTNDRPDLHMVEADNRFTANILYRMGFSWPFIDGAYLERAINSLNEFDFFFREDE